jgi:hypothetical protein
MDPMPTCVPSKRHSTKADMDSEKYRIENNPPGKPAVFIDTADSEEDALTLASCHSENLPNTEISITDPTQKNIE